MNTLKDQMKKWSHANGINLSLPKSTKPKKKKKPKKKAAAVETFTERDMKDLMGVNRDTYTRRRGALRRR